MKTIMEMAYEAGFGNLVSMPHIKVIEAFAKQVREEAQAQEREAIKQIIRETPFSNWFQSDLIEAIDKRGQA